LDGPLAGVATARAQGLDLVWPTVRGLYMAASTPDRALRAWSSALQDAMAAPGYTALCHHYGVYPHALTGAALEAFVQRSLQDYRQLLHTLGLQVWSR
ncbi:MAG: tripartite tricarboxylate transporter substrate binding protein, partial [Burkholderiaceae bacterium]|nr:tripartite tricarboxylate transporter substrate binding protein [Burkholderiaceae bacterium]